MNGKSLRHSLSLRSLLATTLVVLGALISPEAQAEREVTIAWDDAGDPATAGYFVYAQEENSTVPMKLDAGGSTWARVTGLKEGLNYTFFVTAYNPYRLESQPSTPISFRVPVPLQMIPPSANSAGRIRFPAAPGRWYELQASTDMINWTTIWQTGVANNYAWVDYQDTRARYYNSRFYRLQVH